jgi:ribonuclease HIII
MEDKRIIIDNITPRDLYKTIKYRMLEAGLYPGDPEIVADALQFKFYIGDTSETVRIEGLGTNKSFIDLSLINNSQNEYILRRILPAPTSVKGIIPSDAILVQYDLKENDCIAGLSVCGKNDYFGPLVITSVTTCKNMMKELSELSLKEAEFYDPDSLEEFSEKIIKKYPTTSVILHPELYNDMYLRHKDMNLILLKAHVKVLLRAQEKIKINVAIIDRFSNEDFSTNILGESSLKILQPSGAAKHPLVLAAGLVSRSIYLREGSKLSNEYRFTFPRGTGDEVVSTAKSFIKSYGVENLFKVAKVNFKLTGSLI